MMGRIAAIIVAFVLLCIGLGVYLSPDDLASCTEVEEAGKCRMADAIVVISGGDTLARTGEAIKLFKDGWSEWMIFSGAAADKEGPSNAKVMRQAAVDNGVPVSATIIEEYSETTKQNAEQVRQQLKERGIERVILVTSGYHMRRASLEFSNQLGSGVDLVRHPVRRDNHWGPFWWLTPGGWWLALSELAKIVAFYAGGSR